MPSLRYLNSVLTVIAVLLTINLYTLWTAAPATVSPAQAYTEADNSAGVPDARKQRKDMIDELKKLNTGVSDLKTVLTSGKLVVQVQGDEKAD